MKDNESISFLFVIQFFTFLLVIGGFIVAIMIGSISYSTKHSGAYERYDAMVAELDALILPEKTIFDSTYKEVRSSRVVAMRDYKSDYPYHQLVPLYRKQLKLGGWSELGEKDNSDENGESIIYSFTRKDWRLEFMTSRGRKGKSNPYAPWSYAYILTIEWEK